MNQRAPAQSILLNYKSATVSEYADTTDATGSSHKMVQDCQVKALFHQSAAQRLRGWGTMHQFNSHLNVEHRA